MSPVDAYLADLRAALGDRLPPGLKEDRLRETRGHLVTAAQEEGETETIRRYGRPRAVANGLVRSYRGYDTRSVWRLSLPIGAGYFLISQGLSFWNRFKGAGVPTPTNLLIWAIWLLCVLAFIVRVFQTRRWLAGPMITAGIAAIIVSVFVQLSWPISYVSGRQNGVFYRRRASTEENRQFFARISDWGVSRVLFREVSYFTPTAVQGGAVWVLINAAALGLTALSDRRRVRRVSD